MAFALALKLVMLDLDGTLYIGDQPIPGAHEALAQLRARGLQLRFITNTTTKTQQQLVAHLRGLGFNLQEHELISAPVAARLALEQLQLEQGRPLRIWPVVAETIKPDFAGFSWDEESPDYIVLGDIGECWDLPLINRLFKVMHSGAQLIALHKNRFWQTAAGLHVDIGFFVAGLEYVCSKPALAMGKPNSDFFQRVLASAGVTAAETAMVGDDIDSDVGGAQQIGITGVLVKTGKYRQGYFDQSTISPDLLVDSIAQLPPVLFPPTSHC